MKVVMVSSWAPRWCGIATYSEALVEALREQGVEVAIVCHTDGGRPGEKGVYPVIDQQDYSWPQKLYETVEQINPDVIHVQHEFGIYAYLGSSKRYNFLPVNAFGIALPIFQWRVKRRPVVVTYHSVFSTLTFDEALYYDHSFALATANIVHEPYQKEALKVNLNTPHENVFVCQHGAGTWRPSQAEISAAKRGLGLDTGLVVGMMGWWEPNKGFERVIKMWPDIVSDIPEATLVVAGDARPGSPTGPSYKSKLLKQIEACPRKDKIKVVIGKFSGQIYVQVMSTFDIIVLPYIFASQSGNHAHAYQLGIPQVVSAIEGLKSSVEASGAGLLAHNDGELKEGIIRLLKSQELRESLSKKALEYVNSVIGWPLVAQKHIQIYKWAMEETHNPERYERYLNHRVHV